jgi:hypothetical protein
MQLVCLEMLRRIYLNTENMNFVEPIGIEEKTHSANGFAIL